MKTFIKHSWPYLFIVLTVVIFYFPFFFKGLLPVPSDIITGVYFPWLDLSFDGYLTGIPVKNALPSDVVSLTYPLRLISLNLLKQGIWPLWNSYILCGTSLLANFQSAALYPLNFIFILISDFSLAWSLQLILQPLLAAVFMYLFLKNNRLNNLSSILGSILWGFSGFFSLWIQYNTVIHCILYLPLALLSIQKLPAKNLSGLLLSLSIAFSLYAGNPPMTLILLSGCALFAAFTYTRRFSLYLKSLFFVILGFLLASPLLIPGFTNTANSIRSYDSVALAAQIKYLPLHKLITLLIPNYFGNPSTLNQWQSSGLYDNLTVFIGVIPALFFIYSLFLKKTKHSAFLKFFQFLFFLSFLLSIENPLSRLIGQLPYLGLSAMVMTRFSVLTNLSSSIITSIVLHDLFTKNHSIKNWLFPIISVFLLLFIPLLFAFIFHYYPTLLSHRPSFFSSDPLLLSQETMVAIRNSAIPLATLILACFLILLVTIFSKQKSYLLLTILLLSFFEQYQFFKKYNSFSPKQFLYPPNPTTDYLLKNSYRFARQNVQIIPSNTWMPYHLKSISGYDTLHSLRYNQFISLLNGGSLKNVTSRYVEIDRFDSKLLNFLGVSHFVGLKTSLGIPDPEGQIPPLFSDTQLAFSDQSTAIFQNPDPFPPVFSVSQYSVSNSLDETEHLLKTLDLSSNVVLEQTLSTSQFSIAKISDLSIKEQTIKFSLESVQDSLIVTSTSYDPGWKLTIDHQPSPIYIANHAFMAFRTPPGAHSVILEYRPDSFFLGLKIFLASVVFSLFFLLAHLIPKINVHRTQKLNIGKN